MNQQEPNPIEKEFRASRVYQTLEDTGLPADQIARTLGGVSQTVTGAVQSAQRRAAQQVQKQTQAARQAETARKVRAAQAQARAQSQAQSQAQGQPQPAQTPAEPAPPMKLVRKPSAARYYITAAVAFTLAEKMPLYEWYHFLAFLVVLALVFTGSSLLIKGKHQWVPVKPPKPASTPAPEKPAPAAATTGDPEVDRLIADGQVALKKLRAANDAIPDESLSDCIDRMEKASADIFAFIAEHPEKAPQIRKFMNYYLPTTLKLLNSYQRLAAQSTKGETITSTMFNISGMMHTVATAFEKQLDSLFADEAMDVSADISVFETLLKQEGFVEDPKDSIPHGGPEKK